MGCGQSGRRASGCHPDRGGEERGRRTQAVNAGAWGSSLVGMDYLSSWMSVSVCYTSIHCIVCESSVHAIQTKQSYVVTLKHVAHAILQIYLALPPCVSVSHSYPTHLPQAMTRCVRSLRNKKALASPLLALQFVHAMNEVPCIQQEGILVHIARCALQTPGNRASRSA